MIVFDSFDVFLQHQRQKHQRRDRPGAEDGHEARRQRPPEGRQRGQEGRQPADGCGQYHALFTHFNGFKGRNICKMYFNVATDLFYE